jgi:hypothetical protein
VVIILARHSGVALAACGAAFVLVSCGTPAPDARPVSTDVFDTSLTTTTDSTTTTSPESATRTVPSRNCDPAYPTVCIPAPPPDLDCAKIPYRNFKVRSPDPHRFDPDHDGIGCETSSISAKWSTPG